MSAFEGPLATGALCWVIERSDGAGIALTSHDRPLDRAGTRYRPAPGIEPAAITRSEGLDAPSAEVSGALSAGALCETDLALGRWDHARASLSLCDWDAAAVAPMELLAGQLGEVSTDGSKFSAELLGAAAKLAAPVCPSTSPDCRAELGDKRCGVDLAGRTMRARILSSDNEKLTLDVGIDERFVFGRLRFLDGANCGLSTVILSAGRDTVSVRDLPPIRLEAGTRVDLREGCDKRFTTCVERFGNAINFRGEPHLPGTDKVTRYPGV